MDNISEGTLLWEPSKEQINQAAVTKYREWLQHEKGLHLRNQAELWQWSTQEIEAFWESIWEYCNIISHSPYKKVLESREMPGAHWFPGATLNYVEHVFRKYRTDQPAILFKAETVATTEVSWQELQEKTAMVANYLRASGVQKGDRVVAYMPNIPETVIAFLACASIGAIWSVCSPDFGTESVLERFKQIEPKFLFTVDGYSYNGKIHDRISSVVELQHSLPTLEKTVIYPFIQSEWKGLNENTMMWDELMQGDKELIFEALPFDHPIWVLFSSGTT